ncbi:retrovirus-related pol polyprotein from transposon TNT 1-94 [Tanacetum coccineum]
MDEKIKTIENDMWKLATLPKGRKGIRVKWVYKAKKNAKGDVEKYKARLVEKETIRMIIAIAAQYWWKICQMDVNSAFLNGLLEEVYVEKPEGYVAKG